MDLEPRLHYCLHAGAASAGARAATQRYLLAVRWRARSRDAGGPRGGGRATGWPAAPASSNRAEAGVPFDGHLHRGLRVVRARVWAEPLMVAHALP